jgi:hypothetical protein
LLDAVPSAVGEIVVGHRLEVRAALDALAQVGVFADLNRPGASRSPPPRGASGRCLKQTVRPTRSQSWIGAEVLWDSLRQGGAQDAALAALTNHLEGVRSEAATSAVPLLLVIGPECFERTPAVATRLEQIVATVVVTHAVHFVFASPQEFAACRRSRSPQRGEVDGFLLAELLGSCWVGLPNNFFPANPTKTGSRCWVGHIYTYRPRVVG